MEAEYYTGYPITITADRYNGTYSGHAYTAWWASVDQVPTEIEGDDATCRNFWDDVRSGKRIAPVYAGGATAMLAEEALDKKLETITAYWDPIFEKWVDEQGTEK